MIKVSGYSYGYDCEECSFVSVRGALDYFYLMVELYQSVDMVIDGYVALTYEDGSISYYYPEVQV